MTNEYKRKVDHGATPNSQPDPEILPKIPGPFLLVRPYSLRDEGEAKVGSIVLPESYTEDVESTTNIGRVLVVGDLAYQEPKRDELRYGGHWCKVGDYVVWGKNGGKKVVYKEIKCVILTDDEVMMTVENPTDINPHKNLLKY